MTFLTLPWFQLEGWKIFLLKRLPNVLGGSIGSSETSISLYGSLRTGILAGTYDSLGSRVKEIVDVTDLPYKFMMLFVGLILLIYLYRQRHFNTTRQYIIDYSSLILFMILTSEIVHQHYIVWLMPTIIWLGTHWRQRSYMWRVLLLIALMLTLFQGYLSWLDVLSPYIKPITLGLLLLSSCVYYIVCIKDSSVSASSH